MQMSVSVAVCK